MIKSLNKLTELGVLVVLTKKYAKRGGSISKFNYATKPTHPINRLLM